MKYYAHTTADKDGKTLLTFVNGGITTAAQFRVTNGRSHCLDDLAEEQIGWQPLPVHLVNVADLAGKFTGSFGLDAEGYLAGLLHDWGKYRLQFQKYLRGAKEVGSDTRHAIYGAAHASNLEWLSLAFAIAGHHSGLPDAEPLQNALESKDQSALQAVIALAETMKRDFAEAMLPLDFPKPTFLESAEANDPFRHEFATRMIFSALVDADRLDTALWPRSVSDERRLTPSLTDALLEKVCAERVSKAVKAPEGELKRIRNSIFDDCLSTASKAPGFFSLTVPTGGGKTLSSMAFALAHAKAHGLRRVVVVIPYLSIIEQNASEYRKILGEDTVLEHHSAVAIPDDDEEREDSPLDKATENWDAPIIITTSVQFLESLFAASPAKCRKLHRLARSVVIFDEAQTLPHHLLAPALHVLRELSRPRYGVSVVFCSATLPAFRKCRELPAGFSEDEMRPIASETERVFQILRRVNYHLPSDGETLDWPELARKLASKGSERVLCVVNTRAHAFELWKLVRNELAANERDSVFHLSSAMCAQHRFDLLGDPKEPAPGSIRHRLKQGLPCRVVSTQLIEAGVDVDFPVVWRAMGPLDSIVQTAGRCNREGLLPDGQLGEVHVFVPAKNTMPPGYESLIAATRRILFTATPESLATNPEIFVRYFAEIHALPNETAQDIQKEREAFNFRKVAALAKVINDDTRAVIVEFGKAVDIIEAIRNRIPKPGQPRFDLDDLRRLQRYMVNVRKRDFDLLEHMQHLVPLLFNLDLYVLKAGLYHDDLGLLINRERPLDDFLQ